MPLKLLTRSKLKDPLFYLSVILFCFWLMDLYLVIFVKHAPEQLLWWSRAGLFLSIIAIFFRINFLISSLFCALFLHEILWSFSFFSNLFFQADFIQYTNYLFRPNYPTFDYIVGLFHLLLVPFLIFAIIYTKKFHSGGWLGASLFGIAIMILSYFVAHPERNLNCILPENNYQACHVYLDFLYYLNSIDKLNPFAGMVFVNLLLTLIFFIPTCLITTWLAKRAGFKISNIHIFDKKNNR